MQRSLAASRGLVAWFTTVLASFSLVAWPTRAQESAPPYRDHTDPAYLLDATGAKRPIKTLDDWNVRRAAIFAGMKAAMGPVPDAAKRVPLDVQQVEQVTLDGGLVRRKVQYQTEPRDRVAAYLFLPANANDGKKRPAILCLHQTTQIGKEEPSGLGGNPNLHYALHLARRGYVTLAPDYPSFGEHQFDFADPKFGYVSGTMKAIWDNLRGLALCFAALRSADRGVAIRL